MQQRSDSAQRQRSARRPPFRGELVDIGDRRLRLVRAGPEQSGKPLVILEHGAHGCATDWAVVQERLAAKGLRSLAYDRAGLGFSDPGPRPRDGRAVVADLEALLARVGEPGPYLIVAHSMGGLFAHLFAARHAARVSGLVLVDAVTPEAIETPFIAAGVGAFMRGMRVLGLTAGAGYMRPVSWVMGDMIGLTAEASAEKRLIYGSQAHNKGSVDEVQHWPANSLQGREAGPLDPGLPVAVVTAGAENGSARLKAIQVRPAEASRHGLVDHVAEANHASLLGVRHAGRVIRAVEHVLAVAGR